MKLEIRKIYLTVILGDGLLARRGSSSRRSL